MTVHLNHTIVHARNARESAEFMAEILGLPRPRQLYHFWIVETANGVSLDFMETEDEIVAAHYAFLISEAEFDEVFERVRQRGLTYWADPMGNRPNEINRNDGGRGFYFQDPSGHYLEVITRPYGG
jgi:catechol 2,3-dioxygenase-like lactoylglutathione lyase family enzyme